MTNVDASTPAYASGSNDPWVTASFTPPNDSLLVVCVSADWFVSTPTITPVSPGLTFVSRKKQGALNQGVTEIFTAEVGSNGGTPRTVSVTTNLSDDDGAVKVYVVTGYDTAQPVGSVNGGSSTTNNLTVNAITTGVAGEWVFGCAVDWQALGAPSSTDVFETGNTGSLSEICVRKAAATPTAGSVVTLNFDAAGGTPQWTWAAISIRPAAGGGGETLEIGQVERASDVQPLSHSKMRSVGLVSGGSDVQPVSRSKSQALAQVQGGNQVLGTSRSKLLTLSLMLCGSAPLPLARSKSGGLGVAQSTRQILSVSRSATRSLGVIASGRHPQALSATKAAGLGLIGSAREVLAIVLPGGPDLMLGLIEVGREVHPVSAAKGKTLGLVALTGQVLTLGKSKLLSVGLILEGTHLSDLGASKSAALAEVVRGAEVLSFDDGGNNGLDPGIQFKVYRGGSAVAATLGVVRGGVVVTPTGEEVT